MSCRIRDAVGGVIQTLESRWMLAFDPSGREQESLEYLNRMRINPAAEYSLLVNSTDPDVQNAIDFFNVSLSALQTQWNALSAAPPLAWNEKLYNAAAGHNSAMLAADQQTHQAPGEASIGTRVTNAGYTGYSTVGENVYAFAENMFHAHAGFAIDWGSGTNGIQNPPGHRNNIMSSAFREVGVAVLDSTAGKDVGPLLMTQDFGNRFSFGNPFALGVLYNDTNGNGFYNAGEGMGGVTVKLTKTGSTYTTTTLSAGGYQLQVPAGTYTVTLSGGGLGGTITSSITVGSQNVKKDFSPTQSVFAVMNGTTLRVDGTSGADTISLTNSSTNVRVLRNGSEMLFSAASINRIEIYSGDGNDVVDWSGISKNTYIDAGIGDDSVTAGSGIDTLTGGSGKDTLKGGLGADRINGFGTNDMLYGEDGDDRIYGGDHNDFIDGGGGVDRLWGEAGNDTLSGGSSADKLYGGSGNDSIRGGKSNDLLVGEAGNDTLFGEDGDDTFTAKDGVKDVLDGGTGADKASVDSVDSRKLIETLI